MTTRTDSKATLRHLAALKLYANGATFDEVATECGYASRSGAYQAVKAALDDARRERHELADNILDTQICRYTDLYRRTIDELDNAATEGREVGKAQLLSAARGILDSLTKVYGLDEHRVTVTNRTALDDELADLTDALRHKLDERPPA
ncbi:hypothetical protein GII33_20720 [Gordonia pseudamarae]|uniref:hypothetical protein n=1 Tax=Gordonia TaxID=2053 RepID=UPI0019990157|nr:MULTISPECIES: hypothetical protein [Gordonia]MBD0021929.1 hypothetical protein [Gordonia sp. (in: high G+C Gram-positive bacteria)]QHN28035.1 hypothetical protein GII33_20720 [Gordonia pseudamarae]